MIIISSLASRTLRLSFMWVALKHNVFCLCVLQKCLLLTKLQGLQWMMIVLYC
jgi:hypothetical protein